MANDHRGAGVMRIVVAEDEAVIARRIARLTREILGPETTFALAAGVAEAREALKERTDILILDLNLEGDEGFDLIRNRPLGEFETIVISAHSDRALEAFEHGVRDFVAKPFTRERLERALARISTRDSSRKFLGIRKRGEIEFVPVDDVVYVRGAGMLSEVVLNGCATVLHDKLLDQLQDVLPPHFDRIHKSYIVDLRRVRKLIVREGSRYFVELDDGTLLPVGRTKVRGLRRKLA